MIFLDTETCGLHGMAVLLQYAEDDGDINLYNLWTQPIGQTLDLIHWLVQQDIVMFNSAFDWFHLCKLYNVFSCVSDYDCIPRDCIDEIALLEPPSGREICLKPHGTFDLMLHARKGPFQSTMDRNDVRIKRIPTVLAYQLCDELNRRIPLPPIYFERTKSKKQWHVLDIEDDDDFKDIMLKFAPSSALKALAVHALGYSVVKAFKNIEPATRPKELGYAPYALAGYINKAGRHVKVGPGNWKGTWPSIIVDHIIHWSYNTMAREYAQDDITYTRDLYNYFKKLDPDLKINDDDSVLACMVGAVRWQGYEINVSEIKCLREEAIKVSETVRFKNAPAKVLMYIKEVMDDIESLVITNTKKTTLEEISKWIDHPAAKRASEVLIARKAKKEVELYDKLIIAGRFHPSFKVIGTLSSRMAGADGLNPQGIKRTKAVRKAFTLTTDPEKCIDGGDFDAFEISLMDAVYHDPKMHEELLSDEKIHTIWGHRYFFPHLSKEEIEASKGHDPDYYVRSKNGVFAICYFGEGYTLVTRVGMSSEEEAEHAYQQILKDYPVFASKRRYVIDLFCSMKQPNGLGTRVIWAEPEDYIESIFGFRRYFTLENKIVKELYTLANEPPMEWQALQVKVVRRDREQLAVGAVRSALYGSAFAQQSSNMRAAGNHVIQSSGAQITKAVQRKIWDIQPEGIHPFLVCPFNVHDEIITVNDRSTSEKVKVVVKKAVEAYRPKVPLINISWKQDIKNWGGK
jgi:hypothetical protein